jgi:two-component system, chemotaxis family, chemotaxis protein CheY
MAWNASSLTGKPMDDARPKSEPLTILVVDDKADSRQLLMRMLRAATPAVVLEARDGEQALKAFVAHRPCLTFLDIDMPGTDGLAALTAIRAISPDASIVMVSGTSSAVNVTEALALGAAGFVVKPYSAGRILAALQKFEKASGRVIMREEAR